jgi:RNA polymerase sigma-70 factor (sigma-E family)
VSGEGTMNRPYSPAQPPDASIKEVAWLVEESSLGTVGARQLRDRVPACSAAVIRARAHFAGSDGSRAWWAENQHHPHALRDKARELADQGSLDLSDVLRRLADHLESGAAEGPETDRREQHVSAASEAAADWRTFEVFHQQQFGALSEILRARTGLPLALATELIGRAMKKAFDDWEQLTLSGNPAEWVLGCALQIHRSRHLPDEDGSWAPSEYRAAATDAAPSARSEAVQDADVRVTGALAVVASQVPPPSPQVPPSPAARYTADQAVERLYGRHFSSLVRLATLLVRDNATAEEVVQDAFIAMHRGWYRLRDEENALAYLRQAVVNRARSVLRHRAIVERHIPKPPPGIPSAEDGAISMFERSAVIVALRDLPDRQREALILRYYGDLSEAEIAAAMGISRGAVKSHTARGMTALRAALEKAF